MENEELENTEVQAPISEEIVESPETDTQESTATLADTIKKVDQSTLPPFLQFHEDPSLIKTKIEDMYESKEAITGLYKLLEAKGTRQAITRYLIDTKDKPEIRSYDDFNNRGYNDNVNIPRSTYTEEIKLYNEGAYGKHVYDLTGEKRDEKTGAVITVDSRPDFEATSSSDKLETEIFNVMNSLNNRTKSVEESVADKYEEVYDAVHVIASEKSVNRHAIICGEAGVGKTTTVNRAIQDGQALWTPNRRHSTLPTVVKESGSIGSSFTPLLLFFYKNRHNKLILLDDCDGFVVSTNKDIQNFLKALVGPQLPISVSPTILDNANNSLKKEFSDKKKESIIEVNTDRLAEGICNVTANGENFDFNVSFEEAVELGKAFGYNKLSETNKPRKLINRFGEYGNIQAIREVQALNQRAADLENAISKGFERSDMQEDIPMSDGETVEYVIQNKWEFDSSIIFVTNLALSEVDQAVLSRCEKSELRLTMLEYLCRAEQILGDMKIGIESSNAAEVIEWCKYEAFALFKILLLGTTKYKNWAVNIKAHLDFRLLNVITNKFLIRVNKLWAREGIDPTVPTNRPIIEDKVRGKFIEDLIKVLATG